jgi:hypothetical protein
MAAKTPRKTPSTGGKSVLPIKKKNTDSRQAVSYNIDDNNLKY